MTKRNFHPRRGRKPTAREDDVARGVATIFTTAATRVLATHYGWTAEQTTRFGDEMVAEAMSLAGLVQETVAARADTRRSDHTTDDEGVI